MTASGNLNWFQVAEAWSSPAALQAGSNHYEIQGGALVARVGHGFGGDLQLELARPLRSYGRPKIQIYEVSLPCFHL